MARWLTDYGFIADNVGTLTARGRACAAFSDGHPLILGTVIADGWLGQLSLGEVSSKQRAVCRHTACRCSASERQAARPNKSRSLGEVCVQFSHATSHATTCHTPRLPAHCPLSTSMPTSYCPLSIAHCPPAHCPPLAACYTPRPTLHTPFPLQVCAWLCLFLKDAKVKELDLSVIQPPRCYVIAM